MKHRTSLLRAAAAALALIAVSACTTYQLVESGTHTIGSSYRVDAGGDWNAWTPTGLNERLELWTVDGMALQQVRFYYAVEPGDTLTFSGAPGNEEVPRYESGMRADDVVSVFSGTLELGGSGDVEVETLEPAGFGDWPGFRFRLSFRDADGLEYRGLGLGTVDSQDRLHLIVYLATREHYFDAHRDEIERLFASIETL